MTTAQAILERLKDLPDSAQQEVLDFVKSLESRRAELAQEEDAAWSGFSLASAMRGMEDEETPYTLADLKESFS
jgi:vacuolar-type H+-ATPase subunit D/Vma8